MDLKPVSMRKRKSSQQTADLTPFVRVPHADGLPSIHSPLLASCLLARTHRRPVGASEWPVLQSSGAQTEKLAECRASERSENQG